MSDSLTAAAINMLNAEAGRMYELDFDADEPVPCPCQGCEGLRAALLESGVDWKPPTLLEWRNSFRASGDSV